MPNDGGGWTFLGGADGSDHLSGRKSVNSFGGGKGGDTIYSYGDRRAITFSGATG
jgi:hypothetical protein